MDPNKLLPLRIKVAIVIGGTMMLLLAVMLGILSVVLTRGFARVQIDLASERMKRVVYQLEELVDELEADVADNATWDEAYAFVLGKHPDFLSKNFYDDPEVEEDYDVVLAFDTTGKLLGAASIEASGFHLGTPADFDTTAISTILRSAGDKAISGLLTDGKNRLLLASYPIHPTDNSGDSAGNLVYVRFLTEKLLRQIEWTTGVPVVAGTAKVDVRNRVEVKIPSKIFGMVRASFDPPGDSWGDGSRIHANLLITDLRGKDLALDVVLGGEVFQRAHESRRIIFLTAAAGGVVLVLVSLLLLEAQVMRPIARLDREIATLSAAGTERRLTASDGREFIRLAQSMNAMLDEREIQHAELARERMLLAGVFDATVEGVLALELAEDCKGDFRISHSNLAATQLLDRQRKALDDVCLSDVFPKDRYPMVWGCVETAANTGETASAEVPWAKEDGNIRWLALNAARWGAAAVVTFSDVTTRKQNEEKLRKSYEELDRFNQAMIGREERILELKDEVNALRDRVGEPPAYRFDED